MQVCPIHVELSRCRGRVRAERRRATRSTVALRSVHDCPVRTAAYSVAARGAALTEGIMGKLRDRMNQDMILRGLAERTRESYLDAVAGLAKHYRRSPHQPTPP